MFHSFVSTEKPGPIKVAILVKTKKSIMFQWTVTGNGQSPITYFTIKWKKQGAVIWEGIQTLEAYASDYDVKNLDPFTVYTIQVLASNKYFTSDPVEFIGKTVEAGMVVMETIIDHHFLLHQLLHRFHIHHLHYVTTIIIINFIVIIIIVNISLYYLRFHCVSWHSQLVHCPNHFDTESSLSKPYNDNNNDCHGNHNCIQYLSTFTTWSFRYNNFYVISTVKWSMVKVCWGNRSQLSFFLSFQNLPNHTTLLVTQ